MSYAAGVHPPIPHGFEWKGVFIDAALRRVETVALMGDAAREKTFMRLSALQGSILENRIFEDDFKVEAVSTAKLLALANSTQSSVMTIDKSNIDGLMPTLQFDDAVKEDIRNSVNQGLTVTVPQDEMTYQDWSGIGYIKENTETGESGWMLSGEIAGGAWRADLWPAAYQAVLQNAYSEPPNFDPSSAAYIEKITSRDFQIGKVGERLRQALQVKVTDKNRRPVRGVEVTFSIKAGGGQFGKKRGQAAFVRSNECHA